MGPDTLCWCLREVPGRRISVRYSSDRSGGPKLPPKVDFFKKKTWISKNSCKIHSKSQKVKIFKNVKIDPKTFKMLGNPSKSSPNQICSPNSPTKSQNYLGNNSFILWLYFLSTVLHTCLRMKNIDQGGSLSYKGSCEKYFLFKGLLWTLAS